VRLSEYDLRGDPDCSEVTGKCSYIQDVRIEKIIPHLEYNPNTKQNDIALLKLAKDLSFDTGKKRTISFIFLSRVCLCT